ncbi:MAG: ABC transporter ATP-binding protein [Clostridiales bacterium]|nr:ABC transporter ATP-binding protein/permease [Roseburia sp.]MDD7637213.1 ABC transporter ATP-binding protein [Clostridiales bacterium]MDY4112854.1 ABC transporter ATP-binding protein [Roseburia sp.]
MGKIFKNMIPYWKTLIIVLLLLFVQAWCDLSLPAYTSDIIDVGILNNGVDHVLPEAITTEEFEAAKLFMTEEETELWEASYTQEEEIYVRTVTDEEELEELDERLGIPLLINYQMTAIDETTFRSSIAMQTGTDETVLNAMSLEQIGAIMNVELVTFEKEVEDEDGNVRTITYVDMRDILARMLRAGTIGEEQLLSMRTEMQDTVDTMGSSLVKSMGVAYAVNCNEEAGYDIDKIQTSYLWKAGLKMVGMALVMGIATVLVGFFGARVGAGIGRDLRGKVFARVVSFSNAEMDRFSTASLITRSTNDIQQIQMVSAMLIRMIAYAPILGIGGIIKVIETGAGMGWIIVLAVLVILGYVGILMSIAMPRFKLMQKLVDRINLVAREILTGLSVIRAFGREAKEEERFDDANRDLTKTMLFTNRVMTFMMPGMMMIMNLLSVGIVWFGAHKIDAGTMQVGAMTAFITYSMQIVMSFLMLTAMSIMLPRAAVAAERIDEVLRTETTIADKEQPLAVTEHKGVIAFSHVNFRYPGAEADALSDIDFVAEPGKTTAIIGSTGCGKSTLVNLIPRLYDVTAGSVTIDGKDIRDIAMSDLREEIGFVPQKGVLFSGTIASNLRFGNAEATEEEIAEAAAIAQATEFIEEKSDKYESRIAQGGSNVSGGQKQRLAIARAIAKNPRVYIFDDSFSALDLKTDAALRKALASKVQDATVIIVAQRISTILHADQILVLNDGKIVGKGTHEELLHTCETYREIAKSQLSAKELGLEESEVSDHE